MALQAPCGAIREELGPAANGRYPPPRTNGDYGKHEAPLIQANGDPVSDMLYTANFAFIGLYEAAAAGNPAARAAADKLAEFFCRIDRACSTEALRHRCSSLHLYIVTSDSISVFPMTSSETLFNLIKIDSKKQQN